MRMEKQSIVGEIRSQVNASPFVLLTAYHGLKVEQLSELRRQLRAVGAEFHVVKNRLFRHVAVEHGWKKLEDVLQGPSAMIVGQKDVTEAAKILMKFKADNKLPEVKAGMLGDQFLTPAAVAELAELPSREVLLGTVVGTLAAPLTRLVGVMSQKLASLVYVLRAIEDKKRA